MQAIRRPKRWKVRSDDRSKLIEKELAIIAQQYGLEVDGGVAKNETGSLSDKSLTSKNRGLKKRGMEKESKSGKKKGRVSRNGGPVENAASLLQPLVGESFQLSACGFVECDCRGGKGEFNVGSNRQDLESHTCVECGHSIAQHSILRKQTADIGATQQLLLIKLARLSISTFSSSSWCDRALAALGDVCRRNGDSSVGKFLAREIRPLTSLATRYLREGSGPESKVTMVAILDEMYFRLYYHYLTNSTSRDSFPIPSPDIYFPDLESWTKGAKGYLDNFMGEELSEVTQVGITTLWEMDRPSNGLLKIFNIRFSEGVRLFYETGLGMAGEMDTAIKAGKPKKWTRKSLVPPPCHLALQKWRNVCRDWFCHLYSYAVPNEEALRVLDEFSPLVEIGGGVGYWAALLQDRGVEIEVYDKDPTGATENEYHGKVPSYVEVKEGGPDVLEGMEDRTLFLCYPPPNDPMARTCLDVFKGKHIIHVGEWEAETGNRKFEAELVNSFQLLKKVPLPNWGNTAYQMTVWGRKPTGEEEASQSPKRAMLECMHCGCDDFTLIKTCAICRTRMYCGAECMRLDGESHREEHSLRLIHMQEELDFENPLHFYKCYRGTIRMEIEQRQAKKDSSAVEKAVEKEEKTKTPKDH
ncbi:hypothetical protein BSKO_04477 [Bryopsis sp. KO-2023]|nr:hypothetical protein BSKO_04477 [Bryopsis sp. KO-2023]